MMRVWFCCAVLLFAACGPGPQREAMQSVPAASPSRPDGFRRALPGYRFSFPRDHAPHAGYRTEWWYYTGFLDLEGKDERGFQFTIFKVEPSPESSPERPPGAFGAGAPLAVSSAIYIGHFALTERGGGPFQFRETYARNMPGMSGHHPATGEIFVHDASLRIEGAAADQHRVTFRVGSEVIEMNLIARGSPIVQGKDGASRKTRRNTFSHYYSIVDLAGEGTIREAQSGGSRTADPAGAPSRGTRHFRVSAWMDHEFASDVLSKDEPGWDWMHFTLDNGTRYMLFRVRGRDRSQDFFSGARIGAGGQPTLLEGVPTIGAPRGIWHSPSTGADYPAGFRLSVDGMQLEAIPWRNDTELIMPVSQVNYWEGPIDVRGTELAGRRSVSGRGFLEMTGYGAPMAGSL